MNPSRDLCNRALLHGAGGASHSFRHLIPLLAADYRVIALDLPGQDFTLPARSTRYDLDAIAHDISALLTQQD